MLEEGTRLRMKCLLESKLDETSDGFFSLTCFCGARSGLYVHKSDAVAYVLTTGWMVVGGEVFCPRCAAYAVAEVVDKLLRERESPRLQSWEYVSVVCVGRQTYNVA